MDPDTSASRGNYHAHEHIGRTEDVDRFLGRTARASIDSPLSNRSKRVFGHYGIVMAWTVIRLPADLTDC